MLRIHALFWAFFWLFGGAAALGASPSPAVADRAMIASAHPLATRAGQISVAAGGNAVDAAVAVSFAISVVEPWGSGLGGGAFMVTHIDGTTLTWDMREMAPAAASRDMFVKEGRVEKGASIWTARAAGIPGLTRGLIAVHQRYGKLPLSVVMAPAISYARDGIAVSPRMHAAIGQLAQRFNEAARAVFLRPDGSLPPVGSVLVQSDLAATLERIKQTRGEDFYVGETARLLVESVRAEGGIWTAADLAGYVVKERPPVTGHFRGYRVLSMGPPSSGGLLVVQMLSVLEAMSLAEAGFGSAAAVHLMAETMKRAFAMRATGLGDPDFHAVDWSSFIGVDAIKRLRTEVREARRATPAAEIGKVDVRPNESTHTSHFGILMANGDAVACTQTINLRFGNGKVAGRSGVVLNNEMDDFSAMPGSPNAFGLIGDEANSIQPGKRPLSSMTPTILVEEGRAVGVFGSPGGSRIITTTLQSIVNVVEHKMDVSEAISQPRVHHQWYPDVLFHEIRGLSPDTIEALVARGHDVTGRGMMGNAMALWRRDDGRLTGAADPRGEGLAAGL